MNPDDQVALNHLLLRTALDLISARDLQMRPILFASVDRLTDNNLTDGPEGGHPLREVVGRHTAKQASRTCEIPIAPSLQGLANKFRGKLFFAQVTLGHTDHLVDLIQNDDVVGQIQAEDSRVHRLVVFQNFNAVQKRPFSVPEHVVVNPVDEQGVRVDQQHILKSGFRDIGSQSGNHGDLCFAGGWLANLDRGLGVGLRFHEPLCQ